MGVALIVGNAEEDVEGRCGEGMGKGDQEEDGESFYGDLESLFRVT